MSLVRIAPALSLVAGLLMAVPSLASADIAPPPAEDLNCRPGTVATTPTIPAGATDPRGRPARPYPYCAAGPACTSDDACSGGQVCSAAPIGLCLEEREVAPGQRVGVPRSRGCEPDGTCLNINSTCENVRRCVPADSPQAAAAPTAEEPAAETPAVEEPESDPPADEPAAGEPAEPAAEEPASSGGCSASLGAASGGWLMGLPLAWLFVRRRRA
ncbi:MAG: hypothetical protein AB8I08_20625 [Sandaracinaceae bacterium]